MFKVLHEASALSTFYNRKLSFTDNSFSWSNSLWHDKNAAQTISRIKQTFTPAPLRVFRTLYSYFLTKPQVFVSQEVLAAETGVCRSTVRRFFAVAIAHDIVDIEHNFKQENGSYYSNRIRLNAHFLKHEILHILKSLFINMRYGLFQLKSLTSRKPALAANEPIEDLKESYFNKNCTVTEKLYVVGAKATVKKEEAMNKDSLTLIQNNLDKLPLTMRGILKLAVLPVQAVQYILKTGINLNANDIFAYTWGVGKKKAIEIGLSSFNFTLYDQQCKALQLEHSPYIDADRLEELQQREAQEKAHKQKSFSKQSAKPLYKPYDASVGSHDKWGNKRPSTPEEFMQVRKETLEKFKQMQADGDANPFRAMLIKQWESETDASPANPMIHDSPSIGQVKQALSQSMSDNSTPLCHDFMQSFLALGID